jgi:hypothetical protein
MPAENPKGTEPPGLIQLRTELQDRYGVVLDHVQLRQILGYRTMSAFKRAIENDRLGFKVFNIPGRRGKFALSADVAQWLWQARQEADNQQGGVP